MDAIYASAPTVKEGDRSARALRVAAKGKAGLSDASIRHDAAPEATKIGEHLETGTALEADS